MYVRHLVGCLSCFCRARQCVTIDAFCGRRWSVVVFWRSAVGGLWSILVFAAVAGRSYD